MATSNKRLSFSNKCEVCNVEVSTNSLQQHMQGRKHKNALSRMIEKQKKEERGIFVKGFPPHTDGFMAESFFRQLGYIESFKFKFKELGHSFALLTFSDSLAAQYCISHKLYFQGCPLRIRKQIYQYTFSELDNSTPNSQLDHEQISMTLSSCDSSFDTELCMLISEIYTSNYSKYSLICQDLEKVFCGIFRGCKVLPFGSTVTGIAFKGSDLDVFIDLYGGEFPTNKFSCGKRLPENPREAVMFARRLLFQKPLIFSKPFAIPKARIPIVKFVHVSTKVSCDMSFTGGLGVRNSSLINYYFTLDHRVKPLMIILKYWPKKNDLIGQNKLSSYALIILGLFYLQQLEDSIIPTVAVLQETCPEKMLIENWECSFNSNFKLEKVSNSSLVPELLRGFFNFCCLFDFGLKVMCPLIGTTLPKSMFLKPEKLPESMLRYKLNVCNDESEGNGIKVDCDMCIQDPFVLTNNIASRISGKYLETFIGYCSAAYKACDDILTREGTGSSVLKKLFDKNTKPPLSKIWDNGTAHITIPLRSHLIQAIKEVENSGSCNDTESVDIISKLHDMVFEYLLIIFKTIMKFDTNVKDTYEAASKIQRLENQADVSRNETEVRTIECCCNDKLWPGRKAASRHITFPIDINTFIKEAIISDHILERKKTLNISRMPPLNITCVFKPGKEPACVYLEITNSKSTTTNDFLELGSFLYYNLPLWIERRLNEHFEKPKGIIDK